MGKRVPLNLEHEQQQAVTPHTARSIRKRKRNANIDNIVSNKCCKRLETNNYAWHENDDEHSSSSSTSSNDAATLATSPANVRSKLTANVVSPATPASALLNVAPFNVSYGSNAATELNGSGVTDSPKPVYTLRPSVVNGTILRDLTDKPWRLGRPIGKGNFGEIFLASDNIGQPVTHDAKFVVKIEPHTNGPLFVEIHCLMNTAKNKSSDKNADDDGTNHKIVNSTKPLSDIPPNGIPDYIASGSHYFGDVRYRFLVLPRFDRDLHSLIKNARVHQKSVLTLAIHIVNVLEKLHDRGYCHNDVKAQNLMISKCKYLKKQKASKTSSTPAAANNTNGKKFDEHYEEKQQTTDSGNSSEQEANDEDFDIEHEKFVLKSNMYDDEEDEDFDDGATTNSNNSNSMDMFQTPVNGNKQSRRGRNKLIEFSGSNPVRSCRREKRHSIYEEMVKSHYLRPTKRISYSEFYNEDGVPEQEHTPSEESPSSDEEYEFMPSSARRLSASKKTRFSSRSRTRQQLKQQQEQHQQQQRQRQPTTNNTISKKSNVAAANKSKRTGGGSIAISNGVPTLENDYVVVEEERIFLIDFGLASKYQDNGIHRPFIMDQRRAHDGTLEFTSRDAHLGAHSRRSDLECLGYNLVYWSQGYLPWKDAAMQQQQEKVHRSKELLMTDVREMLKQIYGKQVPKYLGEFLHLVGQLAYQERPDYERYRNLFKREFRQLGYDANEMQLSSIEIMRTAVRIKDEVDGAATVGKYDIFELSNKQPNGIMRNPNVSTPYQEQSFQNRVSPKNLRSKSTKKTSKKKKFSWAEVLSQDPDQIARERAVKEFEREEDTNPLQANKMRRYEGKPTYAILQLLQHLKSKGRTLREHNEELEQIMEIDETERNSFEAVAEDLEENDDDEEEEDDEDEDEIEDEEEEEDEESEDEEQEEAEEEEDEDDDDEISDEDETSDNEKETNEDDRNYDSDATTESEDKKLRNKKYAARKTNKTANTTKSTTTAEETALRIARGKAATNVKFSTKTRSSKVPTNKTLLQNVKSMRRGSANVARKEQHATTANPAASAAGEHTQRHRDALQQKNGLSTFNNGGGDSIANSIIKLRERRARRCLLKTESTMNSEMDDESNSNYGPDMQTLNNIWKKFDNESIYARGRTVITSRNYKK